MRKNYVRIIGLLVGIFPASVSAQSITVDACPIGGLACPSNFLGYILTIVGNTGGTTGIIGAFIGILSAFLIYYGFKLIVGAENDSSQSEVKLAYGHAITGAIIVGAAGLLANSFAIVGDAQVIDAGTTNGVLTFVIASFKSVVYIGLVFNLSFQGIRLVVHQDESQADKAKKQFLYGMIGAAIVILADAIVTAVSGSDISIINTQTKGIIRFLLTILGALAVLGMFAAGIFLILSVDEQLKERAKKTILASIVVLAIVVLSLSILLVFVEAPLG